MKKIIETYIRLWNTKLELFYWRSKNRLESRQANWRDRKALERQKAFMEKLKTRSLVPR